MLTPTKTFLNSMFFLLAAAGFGLIFYDIALPNEVVFFLPVGLVAAYGLLITLLLRNSNDYTLAEHYLDSIYFLGFLYTLISLAALFFRLQGMQFSGEAADAGLSGEMLSQAFYFVGISVSTSLAGILFRNIGKGSYLKNHPDQGDQLEKVYELLSNAASSFADQYETTFENLRSFLAERSQTAEQLNEKEAHYMSALDRFVETVDRFNTGLSRSQAELSNRVAELRARADEYGRQLDQFSDATSRVAATTERISDHAAKMPLEAVVGELDRFRTSVDDLNRVVDALISILDSKVGKVG